MTATTRSWIFWASVLALFILIFWLTSKILLPFVAGMVLAYLLDPVVDRLERSGARRWLATTLVLLSFALLIAFVLILIVPVLRDQTIALIDAIPGYIEYWRKSILPEIQRYARYLTREDVTKIREAAANITGTAVGWAGDVVTSVITGGMALIDVLTLIFIMPIVAFYLLRDWDKIVEKLDSYLPRASVATIRAEMREIDRTLSGFIRGQAVVCLSLGLFYAIALSIAGLQFGLAIGLLAGVLSFIPYVGTIVGFVSSTGVAFFQFDNFGDIALIVGIFIFGQAIEGNFLTPRLVGDRVGLHPVWVMFALLAGGSLFGFAGVLLAVPVAAVIGVLVRFGLRQYLASPLYTGELPPPEAQAAELTAPPE